MHDVLAHRLSLFSVRAGALEVTPAGAEDEAVTEAAAAIRPAQRIVEADGHPQPRPGR